MKKLIDLPVSLGAEWVALLEGPSVARERRREGGGLSQSSPLPCRPRKLTLKGYRQHWVVFKETTLSYYKSQEETPGDPVQQLNLKGEGGRPGQDRDEGRGWLGAHLAHL